MPLRDHFRPPLDLQTTWEGLHGQWPAVIVQQLRNLLPPGYVAEPRVHSGSQIEIDVAAFETQDSPMFSPRIGNAPGTATVAWTPVQPSYAVETGLPDYDEYEVQIFDARRGRHLVAAVEIVSPANKDRLNHRNIFTAKCAALLQKGVAISIVDLVTIRNFNLYSELMTLIGHPDPAFDESWFSLYAASCRWTTDGSRAILQAWSNELVVGKPLPTLPLWLGRDVVIPLHLEESYEQACRDLWIA